MTRHDDTAPCVTRPRIRVTMARVRSRTHDAARRYGAARDAPADPREHGERQQEAHAARRGRHDRRVEDQPVARAREKTHARTVLLCFVLCVSFRFAMFADDALRPGEHATPNARWGQTRFKKKPRATGARPDMS